MHQFFESLDYIVKFCDPGSVIRIAVEESRVVDRWEEVHAAAQAVFAGVSSEE
jgi:hypothetical protein